MGYEAQIAGVADAVPGQRIKSRAIRALKQRSIPKVSKLRGDVVRALRAAGHALRLVNGGGTGSLESTRADESVTELTAGSGFYCPALFDAYSSFRHLPAAGFALPVVRKPAAHLVTCHGGGYVASGAAGHDRLPIPVLPKGGSSRSTLTSQATERVEAAVGEGRYFVEPLVHGPCLFGADVLPAGGDL